MNDDCRYTYRIKSGVIFASGILLLLPAALALPSRLGFFLSIGICGLLMILMVARAKLKPGLEISANKFTVRSPFHSEEFPVEKIQRITLVNQGRRKSHVAMAINHEYLSRTRGQFRHLMTRRFGSDFDVIIPDIYDATPQNIFNSLAISFPHLVNGGVSARGTV